MTTGRLLIIADDLTGAADTGHEFARRGYGTMVTLNGTSDDEVIIIDTDSRESSASSAKDAVTSAITTWPADLVYKKVDSTLRGNVATEVVASLYAVGADLAVFAPAFPANDRVTECGRHNVSETPVDELFADGTENPPTTPHLPSLFAEMDVPVVHLPLDLILESCGAVKSRLTTIAEQHEEPLVVTSDATESAHLARIATAAKQIERQVLYAGSAGLARHLNPPFPATGHLDGRKCSLTPGGSALAVTGSTAPATREQVAAVPDSCLVELPVKEAVRSPAVAADQVTNLLIEQLSSVGGAALTTVGSGQNISMGHLEKQGQDIPVSVQKSRIATTLALTTARVIDETDVANLLLTGGAVAKRILGELDAEGISLMGEEVGAGIPIGRIIGGQADGTELVTKAGGFGEPKAIRSWLSDYSRNG
jgi:uncharacterized protein YgbK (DUF1537 family)